MAGGIIQIVAYGYQDVYLTNKPQITFFKIVYRRYTNFSQEMFEHDIKRNTEKVDFGKIVNTKLFRLGDLMTNIYLKIVLNGFQINKLGESGAKAAYVRRLGHSIIREVELSIGGITIDKHYGTWLDIWHELTSNGKKDRGYNIMIGDVHGLTGYNDKDKPEYTLYIPLRFWFNRHIGLAMPFIAIQYHEIHIKFVFEDKEKLIIRNDKFNNFEEVKFLQASLLINYIYLDTEERKKFAYVGHEYLIEQVQTYRNEGITNPTFRAQLDFNHPTKEIIWVLKSGLYNTGKRFLCYTDQPDWTDEIVECSERLLQDSIQILKGPVYEIVDYGDKILIEEGEQPTNDGEYENFDPAVINESSQNGNIIVTNNTTDKSLWINFAALKIGDKRLLDKVRAIITLFPDNSVKIEGVQSDITVRDISTPTEYMDDLRLDNDDVVVYQPTNYGTLIDQSVNPLLWAKFEWNSQERVERRDGNFYGLLQPYLHHTGMPRDGINLYSFAIDPEKHQPTGASNLSTIEREFIHFWYGDPTLTKGEEPIRLYDIDTSICVFGFNYNIFRVISGLAGLAYSG